jgi:hypothetical protein
MSEGGGGEVRVRKVSGQLVRLPNFFYDQIRKYIQQLQTGSDGDYFGPTYKNCGRFYFSCDFFVENHADTDVLLENK